MDLNIKVPTDLNVDLVQLQKMAFIYNALEKGWTVKKIDNQYIFYKKHEGKKEVYLDTYLQNFIESNLGFK
jgi:hypothetical protein